MLEGYAETNTDVAATLDTMEAEAHAAISADTALQGALCRETTLLDVEVELEADGEMPVGIITLTYEAIYRIDASDPETAIT